MHELSIALSMIEQLEVEAARHQGEVSTVYLRLGVLSGVDAQALQFAYELACAGTILAGSHLGIEPVPLTVYCPRCRTTRHPEPQQMGCPHCPSVMQEILAGRELEIRALEMSS